MSGPLEELRAADEQLAAVERRLVGDGLPHYDDDPEWMDANAKFKAAARALAASGTGERPAEMAAAWLHSDPGRCNHVETGDMGHVPSCSNPQGEWVPLVPAVAVEQPAPDAGTGTPSDHERVEWNAPAGRPLALHPPTPIVAESIADYEQVHDGIPGHMVKCGSCFDDGYIVLYGTYAELTRHVVTYHIFDTAPVPWVGPHDYVSIKLGTGQASAVASDDPTVIEGAHADSLLYVDEPTTSAAPSGTTGAARHNVHCGNGSLHEPHDRCNGAAQRWVKCDCLPHRCHHLDGGYFVDEPASGATTGDES